VSAKARAIIKQHFVQSAIKYLRFILQFETSYVDDAGASTSPRLACDGSASHRR
jgi:hypothetical protein